MDEPTPPSSLTPLSSFSSRMPSLISFHFFWRFFLIFFSFSVKKKRKQHRQSAADQQRAAAFPFFLISSIFFSFLFIFFCWPIKRKLPPPSFFLFELGTAGGTRPPSLFFFPDFSGLFIVFFVVVVAVVVGFSFFLGKFSSNPTSFHFARPRHARVVFKNTTTFWNIGKKIGKTRYKKKRRTSKTGRCGRSGDWERKKNLKKISQRERHGSGLFRCPLLFFLDFFNSNFFVGRGREINYVLKMGGNGLIDLNIN